MKAKTKFIKMFYKLPREARSRLVYNFEVEPMTLTVCFLEIKHDTELGKKILKELGFIDG